MPCLHGHIAIIIIIVVIIIIIITTIRPALHCNMAMQVMQVKAAAGDARPCALPFLRKSDGCVKLCVRLTYPTYNPQSTTWPAGSIASSADRRNQRQKRNYTRSHKHKARSTVCHVQIKDWSCQLGLACHSLTRACLLFAIQIWCTGFVLTSIDPIATDTCQFSPRHNSTGMY